ncbi:tetratricopeptide repeat protein [Flagellimonas sediminis]|uniref:Cell surface protein n=1 Tax=Flagellimonas sediminis TaxID=2696468 RepID=A0A6I5KVA4_9FLAO|nr:hypothetical protein [Allomuricauda sediminis]NDV43885.1 hypothetical protein [Allomuricauda sediminis]
MKKIYLNAITLIMASIYLLSCEQETRFKTDKADYDLYLSHNSMETTSKYFELWNNKIKPDSLQVLSLVNVSGEYDRYFKGTGNIEFLKKAERSLKKAVEFAAVGKAGYLRALARNYISQHRFREALDLAQEARSFGSGVNATQSLLFDVEMELGNYDVAKQYLDSIQNMSDFGYLIRVAKWNDHKGDLDTAIRFMEKAKQKAESSKNRGLLSWSYSNLADYYGHAGRIEESYGLYLKTLALDPYSAHAKKGIAWIVYSHERNGNEALRILDSIINKNKSPEYYLLKAEVASFMGDDMAQVQALDDFYKLVRNKKYGDMYNAYNVDFYLNLDFNEKALALAQKEVKNRPTPESYGWLAYSLLKKGEKKKALELVEGHIANATFEPTILFRAAEIYKANGKTQQMEDIKKELLGSMYELGPLMESQITGL